MASIYGTNNEVSNHSQLYTAYIDRGINALEDLTTDSDFEKANLVDEFDEQFETQTDKLCDNYSFLKSTVASYKFVIEMEEQESIAQYEKLRYFGRHVRSLEEYQQAQPVLKYFRHCLSFCAKRKKAIASVIRKEDQAVTVRGKQRARWCELKNRNPLKRSKDEIARVARLKALVRKHGKDLRRIMKEVHDLRTENGLPIEGALENALDGVGDYVPQ